MDFRTRRQLITLAIAFLLLGGLSFVTYRAVLPPPSCEDNQTNQKEEDVDCGGPCTPCAFKKQQPINIFWARFVKVRDNTYDVAAEIANPNVRLAAQSFEYEFKMYDTAGVLVASRRGTSYLYPGETMHIVEIGLTSGRTMREKNNPEFSIRNTTWGLTDHLGPDIIAGNRVYAVEEDEGGVRHSVVRALVQNRTLEDVPDVEVSALVFDSASNLVSVNRTILDTVPAGSTKNVEFAWPTVVSESILPVVIEARSRLSIPTSIKP